MIGVNKGAFEKARIRNLSMVATKIFQNNVTAISLKMDGIYGGKNDYQFKVKYHLYIDIKHLYSSDIPRVFVKYPNDETIRHINIFHPRTCPSLNTRLPMLCWGSKNQSTWRYKPKHRSLENLLKMTKHVLSKQNFKSPARTPQ